jgi:hypothetical protein
VQISVYYVTSPNRQKNKEKESECFCCKSRQRQAAQYAQFVSTGKTGVFPFCSATIFVDYALIDKKY